MNEKPYPLIVFHGSSAGGKSDYVSQEIDKVFLPCFDTLLASEYLSNGRFMIFDLIAGPNDEWGGGAGPERLRTTKGGVMSIDLVIPLSAWVGKTQSEYRDYYAMQLEYCFTLLIERAEKRKVLRDHENLEEVFTDAIKTLREHEFNDWFWGSKIARLQWEPSL